MPPADRERRHTSRLRHYYRNRPSYQLRRKRLKYHRRIGDCGQQDRWEEERPTGDGRNL